MTHRRTKIIATLGPASTDPVTLEALIQAGVNCFRINCSHSTHQSLEHYVSSIRKAEKKVKKSVSILADLQGPKIRIGQFNVPSITLQAGAPFTLQVTEDPLVGDLSQVAVHGYPNLAKDVKPEDVLILGDNQITLTVEKIINEAIHCVVQNDGTLSAHKGVNLQGGGLAAPAFTEKDQEDLTYLLTLDIDYLALSFVQSAQDIHTLRAQVNVAKKSCHIIAKIERSEAIEGLKSIIEASDGIMIARGDLAIEVGEAQVPALQKQAIQMAIKCNKASIVATQMMESMIKNPHPTRAEISDVANAVLDGSDAVMLSAETAVGAHPIEVVKVVHEACLSVEHYPSLLSAQVPPLHAPKQIDEAIAIASVTTANQLGIDAIVAFTESGTTPLWMSRLYTEVPIYALSAQTTTLHRCPLYKNVYPLYCETPPDFATLYTQATQVLKNQGLIHTGQRILITHGEHLGVAGETNALKIMHVN